MKLTPPPLATVLTLAGSDSSAGAGLQADLKTIHALGAYALTVPTAITAQNSLGVSAVFPLEAEVIKAQLDVLLSDYQIQAVKIGMLGNLAILKMVIDCLKAANIQNIVLDTVLISSSGKALLEPDALPTFITELLPLASVITPNLPELNVLLKRTRDNAFLGCFTEMEEIGQLLFDLNIKAAVIKGGHSADAKATDYLIMPAGEQGHEISVQTYSSLRLKVSNNHGTGCTYSSAIATSLAKGLALNEAVREAKSYLFNSLSTADRAQPSQLEKPTGELRERKGGLNHLGCLLNKTNQ
ncbi:MAG: hydroxymethylpyrimidine/phosphomethylpyrimidine kinase [Thiomicrorhabdus sp.]|nr:MAG: hydroxymethylpyrimidine/phosphomethylpyrimidine kinase [Thiomicrorhabdus sp.]